MLKLLNLLGCILLIVFNITFYVNRNVLFPRTCALYITVLKYCRVLVTDFALYLVSLVVYNYKKNIANCNF